MASSSKDLRRLVMSILDGSFSFRLRTRVALFQLQASLPTLFTVPHISTAILLRRRLIAHTKTGEPYGCICVTVPASLHGIQRRVMCETTLHCAVDKMFEVDILCRHKKWLQKCRHNSGCKTVDINVRCRHQFYQTYVDMNMSTFYVDIKSGCKNVDIIVAAKRST